MCGGGGGTTINYPDPPAQPSTADAVNAYTSNMPKMIETQMQYAPQLAQQQYDIASGLAPRYAGLAQNLQSQYAPEQAALQWQLQQQYAPLMAQQQQDLQQMYEPEAYAARQAVGDLMQPGYLTSYAPPEGMGYERTRTRLTNDLRGAWAQRGLGKSGMSALDEAKTLAEFEFPYQLQREQLGLQELGRRQNLAMSLMGRFGVPNVQGISTPTIATPNVGTPNLMGGYDFGSVQSGMQQGYGTYMGGFNAQQQTLANAQLQQAMMPNPWGQVLGSAVGSLAGGVGMGVGAGIMKKYF